MINLEPKLHLCSIVGILQHNEVFTYIYHTEEFLGQLQIRYLSSRDPKVTKVRGSEQFKRQIQFMPFSIPYYLVFIIHILRKDMKHGRP